MDEMERRDGAVLDHLLQVTHSGFLRREKSDRKYEEMVREKEMFALRPLGFPSGSWRPVKAFIYINIYLV